MTSLESLLQQAGFTDYEAKAYIALLQKSPQTGYELAKTSRIPRANVYGVLQKLEDRGAATRIVSEDGSRYAAVEAGIVLRTMKADFSTMMKDIEDQVSKLSNKRDGHFVEHFQGYSNLISFANDAIGRSKDHLLLAARPQESKQIATELDTAIERGVSVAFLCSHGCEHACSACKGEFFRDPFPVPARSRWLICIADQQTLVAGEIDEDHVHGFRTQLPLLAKIASLYVEQSMLFSTLIEPADGLQGMLSRSQAEATTSRKMSVLCDLLLQRRV